MAAVHESLAERVRAGDHEAWEQLWEHLRPQIYATLGRLLKDVPGMEPEDVLGWTMMEAWRLVRSHDPTRSKVGTYVVSSLRGRIQNLRRDARAKGRALLLDAARPTEGHDPLEVPDHSALFHHHRAEIWADIELSISNLPLPETHAAVLEAVKRFPDSSVAEVARMARVREEEAHRFLRGVGSAIARSSGTQRSHRRLRSAPRRQSYVA
ncbi:sigma-70 family RNA polymerase sigma factor [bacterium]|nr:MAG: sigma-70 family RNA polymerase sigma factor [bacterium]